MKYVLVWKNIDRNIKSMIATFEKREYALASIWSWWKEHNFTPDYIRTSDHKGADGIIRQTIDYGLHTCFYELWEVPDDYKVNYAKAWMEYRSYANGVKECKIVDFEYDEYLPHCVVGDTHITICRTTVIRNKWYPAEFMANLIKNVDRNLERVAPRIRRRERQAIMSGAEPKVIKGTTTFTL